MKFVAVTCTFTDLVDLAAASIQPQQLLVENCFKMAGYPEYIEVYAEVDSKLLKQFPCVYAVLHLKAEFINRLGVRCWAMLFQALEKYKAVYGLKGYYFVINSILPSSFYGFTNNYGDKYWGNDYIVDILNQDQYPPDMFNDAIGFFDYVVVRSYDHFNIDPVTGGKTISFTHDINKTIAANVGGRYLGEPKKYLLGLSTHGTRFENRGCCIRKVRRGDIINAKLSKQEFEVEDGMSWDSSADIYHKLNVFIGMYKFHGVCIEDYKNDLGLKHPLSVYSLCMKWELHATPPDESAMPLNVLVPRRDTKSNSTSYDGTTNPEGTCSTNHKTQV